MKNEKSIVCLMDAVPLLEAFASMGKSPQLIEPMVYHFLRYMGFPSHGNYQAYQAGVYRDTGARVDSLRFAWPLILPERRFYHQLSRILPLQTLELGSATVKLVDDTVILTFKGTDYQGVQCEQNGITDNAG